MYVNNIREKKKLMRDNFKRLREEMPLQLKKSRDIRICSRVVASNAYKNAETILIYVSTQIEADTYGIIKRAFEDGKTVAVPRCVDGTREMEFFIINSFEQLEKGTFSVMEPIREKCVRLENFDGTVCIVPALCYDLDGYRLGYGKGYYDRFLSAHPKIETVGICYCCCIVKELIRGKYDKAVNTIVTEKFIKKTGGA